MKTAEPLDGDDLAGNNRPHCSAQRFIAGRKPDTMSIEQIQLWATLGTRRRLCVETPIQRVIVLSLAPFA